MKAFPNRKQRAIWIFSSASFLHDVGSDMIYPLWPVFVTSVLGADMTVLGLIDGISDSVVSVSQAISGYVSDRIKKRKVFVWIGYLCGGLARIGYAFAPSWGILIPFRILDRSGKMRASPRDAMVSEISTKKNRGANFGILRMLDNGGAVVGVLVALLFFKLLGFRRLFFVASVPSLVSVFLIKRFIHEKENPSRVLFRGMGFGDTNWSLRLYLFLSTIFSLGAFSYSFLLVLSERAGFAVLSLPLLYLLYTAVAAVFSYPFGRLTDIVGRRNVLFISFLCWIGVLILFIAFKDHLSVIAAFFFYGLHLAALEPSRKALLTELAPRHFVATTLGGFQLLIGVASLPASLGAGLLWDWVGQEAPLYISLFLTFFASFLLIFVKEKRFGNNNVNL